VAGHGRDVDEVTGLLPLHVRQRGGNALTSIIRSHSSTLQSFEWRLRHQAGIVDHDVDSAIGLHRRVDESLDLLAPPHVGWERERLASAGLEVLRQRLQPVRAPSTTVAPCAESSRAVASPKPLLAPVTTTTLSLIPSVIGPCLLAETALPSDR
jgi:hypothetical protein